MINFEFLIVAYIVSLFVDWVFQSDWQATNKSKWNKEADKTTSFHALFNHSLIYATGTTFVSLFLINGLTAQNVLTTWLVLCVSHFIIDTRIPVKWIMKKKGMSIEQINDFKSFGFMHLGIDHRLHELALLVLAFFVV